MTGHPANPNEATVQRAAAVAVEIDALRREAEASVASREHLVQRVEAAERQLVKLQDERTQALDALGSTEGDVWLPTVVEVTLSAYRGRVAVAITVASAVAFAFVLGAVATWWDVEVT